MTRLAGVVAGVVAVVVAATLAIALVLSASNETSWTDLGVGDCFDLAGALADDGGAATLATIDTVDCSDPHDAQVVAVGELVGDEDPGAYPADDALFATAERECARLAPAGIDPATFAVLPIVPDERTWEQRRGRFACVAVVVGGGTVTRSALPGA